jgi:phage terminase large subunit-like protein
MTASLHSFDDPARPEYPRLVPAEAHGVNKYGRAAADSPLVNTDPPRCYFFGVFPGLEVEMTGYTETSRKSPDRLDAFVYGLSFLSGKGQPRYGLTHGIF